MADGYTGIADSRDNRLLINSDGSINIGTGSSGGGTGVAPFNPTASGDIVNAVTSVADAGSDPTLYTVPAGRTFVGSISISALNRATTVAGNVTQHSVYTSGATLLRVLTQGNSSGAAGANVSINNVYVRAGGSPMSILITTDTKTTCNTAAAIDGILL